MEIEAVLFDARSHPLEITLKVYFPLIFGFRPLSMNSHHFGASQRCQALMSGLFKEAESQTRHRARPLGRGGHGLWTLRKGGVGAAPGEQGGVSCHSAAVAV